MGLKIISKKYYLKFLLIQEKIRREKLRGPYWRKHCYFSSNIFFWREKIFFRSFFVDFVEKMTSSDDFFCKVQQRGKRRCDDNDDLDQLGILKRFIFIKPFFWYHHHHHQPISFLPFPLSFHLPQFYPLLWETTSTLLQTNLTESKHDEGFWGKKCN